MITSHQTHLTLYFAHDTDRAVILRRGPRKDTRMILWNTGTDTFEDGQWLRQDFDLGRCALSPDGLHFLFIGRDWRRSVQDGQHFTAISRPPYFTALSLYWHRNPWMGGGRFLDAGHVLLNPALDPVQDSLGAATGLRRVIQGDPGKGCTSGLRYPNGEPMEMSLDLRAQILNGVQPPQQIPPYITKGGKLFRVTELEHILIRDLTDMTFEPIRAPYADHAPTPDAWHPLDPKTP
ncbi:hypothetical protein [Actibacterium sp. 188UL27-1]|uniref:hypothetical protein n=1 Tax=Actibacterium sp. 188UL27-1 TaxID=2786961 RepID=UPI00195AE6B3|nr:hypothetical protein [Actibacterium sp. 188UL27-1]MBM7066063.1 hypothetical protein [Actibacterium sp. 188UL27-1]